MDDMITKRYMKLRGDSIAKTHEHLAQAIRSINKLQGKECVAPSCKTVNRRINEIPEFLRDKARYGTAFANNKWRYSLKGDLSTRILERVEVDHTLLDIWVLDPMTGIPLGRPWITIFIDRMSGYILGLHISFYGPSAATIAAALKNSIEPKDLICSEITGLSNHWSAYGIGELYVMDNGLEMHSSMFRRIGWELQTDFLYNPVRKPWLKASIERTMMEVCRVLPMAGKVYSPIKNSIPEDPHKTAAIMFDDLCDGLIRWAVDVYPMRVNRETLARPFDLWHEGIETGPAIILPSTMNELELSMGIAIERTIGKDGALFQYIRFNSVELQDYCRNGSQSFRTEIRINPDDFGSVHAFLPKEKKWLQLDAVRPDQDYAKGLSLLQHQIIRNEAGKRLKRINAEEQLREAQYRLHCHWSEATSKGKSLRRKMNLVRLQGLTSARVIKQEEQRVLPVPESSEIMKVSFETVNPFKAFSLEEE
jgi:putative transposase